MNDDAIALLRDSEAGMKELQSIMEDLDKDEAHEILIPDKEDLFTDEVSIPEGAQTVNINGRGLHLLYAKIVNQLNQGESPIIIIVGKEGKGKSMTALRVANKLHQVNVLSGDFDPEEQTLYDGLEFLIKVRNSTREVIMVDEANEVINVNDYHQFMNRAVASTLRTQRKRENVYIFVGPELQKIDGRVREKADVVIDMTKEQFGKVTAYNLKHGKRNNRGKDYKKQKYPAYVVPDIDEELKKTYEKIDNEFKGSWMDEMIKEAINERIEEMQEDRTVKL